MKIINLTFIASMFLILLIGFLHPISSITQDLGRHLINGQIILETQQVPKTNFFSYTYPDFPFINHHWLSEVIFYLISKVFGFNGLLIISTITVLLAFFLIFFSSLKQGNNVAILTIISLLYLNILFERTDVRPEIFSFLFLSIFIIILYQYKEKFTKWIFLLPLIEVLWVNMHIYFVIGIAVIGLFLIDAIWENRKTLYRRYISILVVIFLSSVFSTLINPNGLNGALYPLNVFQNYGYSIEENQNIFFLWNYFHKPTIIFFAISAFLLFLGLALNFKKTKIIDWLLAIFFTVLATAAIRNLPLFAFATFIPFSNSFSNFFSKESPWTRRLLFIIIIWQLISLFSKGTFGFGEETGAKKAADFFIQNNLKGPIFNNFDIGSYLDYRFYPFEKVFVDGRPEAYPASFFQEIYIPMQENKETFEKIEKQYHFNSIFFAHSDQTPWASLFLRNIVNNPSWKMIYLDNYAVIFFKNNHANKNIINGFAINNDSLKLNNLPKDMNSLLRLAIFFQNVEWKDKEKIIYQHILEIDPNRCNVLFNLSVLLSEENNPASNIYSTRFTKNCR